MSENRRFAPQEGQFNQKINVDMDSENSYWLKHWDADAPYGPDSDEAAAWALSHGWTAEQWAQSGVDGKRAEWRDEWESRQATKQQKGMAQ